MIGKYTIYEWLLFFYVYSFLGWIFESAYVSFKETMCPLKKENG